MRTLAALILGTALAITPAFAQQAEHVSKDELITLLSRQRDDAMLRAATLAQSVASLQAELAKTKDDLAQRKK